MILRVLRHAEQVPADDRDVAPASCPRCWWQVLEEQFPGDARRCPVYFE